ncbi:MAG: GNAT family N-acetyltransferase, partial [Verrucomicrobiota bacterium]
MSFSIELELQKFPKTLRLKDAKKAMLRPLRADDEKELHELFQGIPERERMFIKHRVQDKKVIRDWCKKIDYGRNLPLVGLINGKLVGVATLHQQLGGWKRHIGRVSVLVHPAFRGRGLATALHSGDPAFDTLPAYFKQRLEPALRTLLKSAASGGQVRTDIAAEELLGAVASLCMHAY